MMETKNNASKKALLALCKDLSGVHTAASLGRELGFSRPGMWKVVQQLHTRQFIRLMYISVGKRRIAIVRLNWNNPLVEKTLALYLSEEAIEQRRWRATFEMLEKTSLFLLLYGSTLTMPKNAHDTDILAVISRGKAFAETQRAIDTAQKTQLKNIHSIIFTEKELKNELTKPNPAFVAAIKKGVVLFGQETFVQFMKKMQQL